MELSSKLIGLFCFALQALALIIFSAGFFQFRSANSSDSKRLDNETNTVPPSYDRLVFILIDALRADFVYSPDSGFEFVRRSLREMPFNSKSFIAKARAPTVTMPRLKALTAGSPPVFLDLVLNFDESSLAGKESDRCGDAGFKQETWIKGFYEAGKKIIFYGDDTWLRLFPGCFTEQHGVSSFFVQDYTGVDNQVTERAIPKLTQPNWDVLILHYLGLDHIGHIDGARSKLMKPKQMEMDDIISRVYQSMLEKDAEDGKSSLILVLGDHGMADNGNHGGSSDPEVNTAAIFMSPSKPFEAASTNPIVIDQVDMVPTISSLFGVPIPASNTGKLIEPLIPSSILKDCLRQNLIQLAGNLGGCSAECSDDIVCLRSNLSELYNRVSSHSGEYNLKLMLIAIIITCVSALLLLKSLLNQRAIWKELTFTCLYVAFQASSSFIEEEHEFWNFSFISILMTKFLITKSKTIALILVLARIPRYWNSVGYQRAELPDSRSWLQPKSNLSLGILFSVLLFSFFRYKSRRRLLKALQIMASLFIFGFKLTDQKDNELILARLSYTICISWIFMQIRWEGLNSSFLYVILSLFLFLVKIHNSAILGILSLIGDLLLKSGASLSLVDYGILLTFIHYSYFALGNSNLIVSLDFSNAYIGLTQFNMITISTITWLISWSGPIIASLLLLISSQRLRSTNQRCIISSIALWRTFVTLGLLISLTIHRSHLFIWSVFAPRLLFEFGWTLFYTYLLTFQLLLQ